jgi:DNA repair protein RecN (Recombination protein N)
LTAHRQEAALKLEKAITKELRSLNMAKAVFHCEISKQERTKTGCDRIEFYFSPNVGEKQISVRDCASGGELSRIMLALQTLLSGKERIPSLVFDEIDANIGGETAVVVGEKLKQIGQKHQVLCITHFPQVAKQADHHLQISKQEKAGRTVTTVQVLNQETKERELTRMLGG